MSRLTTIFAACLITAGVITMAGPTFGFSSLAADRGVGVETAADESSALLGLEAFDDSIDGRQDTANALRIHNNFDEQISVTAEANIDTTDVEIVNPNWEEGSFDGEITDEETIMLGCTSGGSSGTATLTVNIEQATSGSVVVSDVLREATVSYRCSGPPSGSNGFEDVSISDVVVAADGSTTQEFSFTPEGGVANGESVEITFATFGIDYSSTEISNIDGVKKNNNVEFEGDSNGGTITVTANGKLKNEVTITLEGVQPTEQFFKFGLAEFSRTDGEGAGPVWFGVTDNSGTAGGTSTATMSTTATSAAEEPITIRRSNLKGLPYEEFETIDNENELIAVIESNDGIVLIDDR